MYFVQPSLVLKFIFVRNIFFCISWNTDDAQILHSTLTVLKEGHVIAVPTDTIYGLACLAQNSEAIKKVYDLKGRNSKKPLAICVGEVQDIYRCVLCDLLLYSLSF